MYDVLDSVLPLPCNCVFNPNK